MHLIGAYKCTNFCCRRRNCAGLYERFYVKIDYDGGKVYEIDFKCGKCKSKLVEIEDISAVNNRPCPKCNQKALRVEETVLWD